MGRTVPSFRMLLEGIIEELSAYRRALRGEDRNAFDSLMKKVRVYASSCTVAPTLDLMEASSCPYVEEQKEIGSLRRRYLTMGAVISITSKEHLQDRALV